MGNLHSRYNAKLFLEELSLRGFAGKFDFFYLPMDFDTLKSKGYSFANFIDSQEAQRFYAEFHAKPMLLFNKVGKLVEVAPSSTQGFHNNICWYLEKRKSRVLNPWFQPLLFTHAHGEVLVHPLYENFSMKVGGNSFREVPLEVNLKYPGFEPKYYCASFTL